MNLRRSTVVVLAFAAAGLLWANLSPYDNTNRSYEFFPNARCDGGLQFTQFGWPHAAVEYGDYLEHDKLLGTRDEAHGVRFHRGALIHDALMAYLLLILTCYVCEWPAVRRLTKRTSELAINRARRRRPQIHLSTAVVLMFAAGCLMWPCLSPPAWDAGWFSKWEFWPFALYEQFTAEMLSKDILIGVLVLVHLWTLCERIIADRRVPRTSALIRAEVFPIQKPLNN